jgi:uncharacterized protein YciI
MYVLVLFREGPRAHELEAHAEAHNEFVTSLVRRNLVLLGGDFSEPIAGAHAAYLLRCDSFEAARETIAEDPFFADDVLEPKLVEWRLVGVNPDAVDPADLLTPRDV